MSFKPLPIHNDSRKTGFEFEIAEIKIEDIVKIIVDLFGGNVIEVSTIQYEIKDTELKDFQVEVDAVFFKKLAKNFSKKRQHKDKDEIKNDSSFANIINYALPDFVPLEIITSPLSYSDFSKLEKLRSKLQKKGAVGTSENILFAFGTHLNPDIPSDKVNDILDILRAFLLLYPWLKSVMKVDFSRKIVNYINPFPKPYIELVLANNYKPSFSEFIADYLKFNPTRNRSLDLLPLFSYKSPKSLNNLPKEELKLVKARPAFHYRLPNCDVQNPNWRISEAWNSWVLIEELAVDKKKLASMSSKYLKILAESKIGVEKNWKQLVIEEFGYEKI